MIPLIDKTNVGGVTADWPFGKIQNKTLSVDGTPVNEETYQDFHQFFEKMFAESGILANGLPDNQTNDFQLFEAFTKLTHPAFDDTGLTFASDAPDYDWNNAGSPFYDVAFKAMPNEVALCGVAESGCTVTADVPVMTLPAGARPASEVVCIATIQDGAANPVPQAIKIETSGVVTALGLAPTLGTYKIYFDGVSFRK